MSEETHHEPRIDWEEVGEFLDGVDDGQRHRTDPVPARLLAQYEHSEIDAERYAAELQALSLRKLRVQYAAQPSPEASRRCDPAPAALSAEIARANAAIVLAGSIERSRQARRSPVDPGRRAMVEVLMSMLARYVLPLASVAAAMLVLADESSRSEMVLWFSLLAIGAIASAATMCVTKFFELRSSMSREVDLQEISQRLAAAVRQSDELPPAGLHHRP